ncbi:MAG TPA: hypothetical protein VIK86_00260 [Candidatus Paceibacterota bacterium]
MEEKLSDKICKDVFQEFYENKDYQKSLKKGKRVYRLLMKNTNQDFKDDYYIWMILMIIIKSYDNIGKIEKSLKYILLSLRKANDSNCDWQKMNSLYYLIRYYTHFYNKNTNFDFKEWGYRLDGFAKNTMKSEFYFKKLVEICIKTGDYQILIKVIELFKIEI